MDPLLTIGGIAVYRDGNVLRFTSGLAVDADGCPTAYHPDGCPPGRDHLANAGHPGNWYGLACDESGVPFIQGASDPAPGFYVSTTALADGTLPTRDPRRYVDSARIPYLSVPPDLLHLGVHKGDVAFVTHRSLSSPALVADVGPHGKLGEGSVALAAALGLNSDARHGGIGAGVSVTIWMGSRATPAWPRLLDDLARQVEQLRGAVAA